MSERLSDNITRRGPKKGWLGMLRLRLQEFTEGFDRPASYEAREALTIHDLETDSTQGTRYWPLAEGGGVTSVAHIEGPNA